ncbi:MAG: long-chain fatty acid--CoA ligase [Candidatus Rokuibacteriota bacterium]|nr:MAG: long-chain fatty acid--CoA ligase [Candidatus Rokubacteria bacterium]
MALAADQLTLPRVLAAQARRFARHKVALREKKYGIWQQVTWDAYAAHVRAVCLGLLELGLERGDKLAVISGNRPAWLYAELAAQAAGAIPVGIFVDSLPEHVRLILHHSEARFVLVEDQEQADKILAVRDALPSVERIIVDDMRGLEGHKDASLISLDDVERMGRDADTREPGRYEALLERGAPDDVAVLLYTSGTTGTAKAAMISHRNLLATATNVTCVDPVRDTDEIVSFLPFAWIGEQNLSVAIALQAGATVNFPEEPATVREDLREIGPHVLIAPPRFWEAMCSEYQVKIADAPAIKRAATRLALAIGARAAARRVDGRALSAGTRLMKRLAQVLALRTMLDKFGLARVRYAYTGGAPLGPEIFGFFRAIGLNLKQVYGQTESSGICVLHPDTDVRAETLGKPTPGTRVRVSESGEILVAGENVFLGYYKNAEATAKTISDGWLSTGDAGLVDDRGHLVMIDRLTDVLRLADGSRFSPALIENKLKFSPHVREAVVIGEDRPHVVALIQIDMGTVGNWAEANRLPFTTFKDLSQKAEVTALVADVVARVNEDLPGVARIRAFGLFDKELHADDGELTRTQKVRRSTILTKYQEMIEDLYAREGAPR